MSAPVSDQFLEIEYKFLLDPIKDPLIELRARIQALQPVRVTDIKQVKDVYYASRQLKNFIFRHRFDAALQHLSAKEFRLAKEAKHAADDFVRKEVNLVLDLEQGDQENAVTEFLKSLNVRHQGTLRKDIEVYYFKDCEVCIYQASAPNQKTLVCLELEAKGFSDESTALKIIGDYKRKLGIEDKEPELRSLYEMLFV